jgi:hypothetical protein
MELWKFKIITNGCMLDYVEIIFMILGYYERMRGKNESLIKIITKFIEKH